MQVRACVIVQALRCYLGLLLCSVCTWPAVVLNGLHILFKIRTIVLSKRDAWISASYCECEGKTDSFTCAQSASRRMVDTELACAPFTVYHCSDVQPQKMLPGWSSLSQINIRLCKCCCTYAAFCKASSFSVEEATINRGYESEKI